MQISIAIGENVATGRAIAAARMLLGLNQAECFTGNDVERDHGVRDDTLHAPQITGRVLSNPLGLEMTGRFSSNRRKDNRRWD
jgi:hypothetical protein